MENKYISENLVLFAIFVPKNFHNWPKFDKVLTKSKFAQFFRHGLVALCSIGSESLKYKVGNDVTSFQVSACAFTDMMFHQRCDLLDLYA